MKSPKNMSFWDHLEELRGIAFRMAGVLIVLTIGAFLLMRWFFDTVILAPCRNNFPIYALMDSVRGDGDFIPDFGGEKFDLSLMTINLGSQFMTHLSASLWLAVTIAFPILIWQLWSFISPGLYENERRGSRKAFVSGMFLFYLGVAVGYFMVFPLALRFLSTYQLNPDIAVHLTLDSYMDTFYMIMLAMGVVFEIPLLAWMLGRIGVLKRNFFTKYRKHAIIVCAALAGIITPTSDAFTLLIVFLPIYGLWELSAFVVPKPIKESTPENE